MTISAHMTPPPADPRAGWDLPGFGALPFAARLSPRVGRVVAPNASHMTLDGTNTYVIGEAGAGAAFVVDPGPPDPTHLIRVTGALSALDAECAGILVTHHHLDHSEAAREWSRALGAPVWAPTPEVSGSTERVLTDGQVLSAGGTRVTVLATPGHTADHVCFRLEDGSVLSGDHILGRGTSVVAWPEGDLAAYLDSLRKVRDVGPEVLYPGHGPELAEDPTAVIDFYLAHRAWREAQIVAALAAEPALAADPSRLVAAVYPGLDPRLVAAAELSTRAGLEKLRGEGRLPPART